MKQMQVQEGWPFYCVHCERDASGPAYTTEIPAASGRIYALCWTCGRATNFEKDAWSRWVPRHRLEIPGAPIDHLPPEIERLYEEIRGCMAVNAYTAAVLAARTLLMHVAVDWAAKEGEHFTVYVDHLVANQLVPITAKEAIDHVRKLGNHGAHKIPPVTREDATLMLRFVALLLRFVALLLRFVALLLHNVYEAPGSMKPPATVDDEDAQPATLEDGSIAPKPVKIPQP